MTKQRESLRREKDLFEKNELKRKNEEAVKNSKLNSDKLNKRNYTYDYNGSVVFIKRPNVDTFPGDFNVSKISKKTLKPEKFKKVNKEETADDIMDKFFSGKKTIEVVSNSGK